MALLDVNVLVALTWDSHVHHVAAHAWFHANGDDGWATCPATENGFVRVCSNPKALPNFLAVDTALAVLSQLRRAGDHRFLADDVSPTDSDFPAIAGHRQVTDAHLLTLARRRGTRLVTFDTAIAALAENSDVELLRA